MKILTSSLGFRVGKFCNSGLLNIVYGSYFFQFLISIKIMKWSLGFRVENFAIVAPWVLLMALFFQILILNENTNF